MWGFELVVMTLMIGVNSIFAAYEIALASITLPTLKRLEQSGRRGARDAAYMKENMEASLAVVQLGITLVGAVAAAVGGAGAEESIAPWLAENLSISAATAEVLSLAVIIAPLTVVTIVFGELVPKVFALRNAQSVLLFLSPPMRWFSISVGPIVWLFETTVKAITSWGENQLRERRGASSGDPNARAKGEMQELQDLRASAAIARASRLIGPRQEDIIIGAAEMQQRPVSEIMLPVEHISTLAANDSLSDNLIAAHLDMHTRFPVVQTKGDPQSIIGYVNVKDLLATLRTNPTDASIRAIIRRIPELRSTQPILECLEQLMQSHTHIAIVRDPQNIVVGMVSLEDIIEELVGEIQDEYDRLPSHIAETGSGWTVGGGILLERLNRITGLNLSLPSSSQPVEHATLTHWASAHSPVEIQGGQIIQTDHVRLVVRKIRRKQLQECFVQRIAQTS